MTVSPYMDEEPPVPAARPAPAALADLARQEYSALAVPETGLPAASPSHGGVESRRGQGMRRPRRHAVLAALALLVFLPTGMPALAAAFGVDDAFLAGDMRLARRRSRAALAWGLASVVLAPVLAAALCVAAFTALSDAWSNAAGSLRQAAPGSSLVLQSPGMGGRPLPGGTQDQLLTDLGLVPQTGQAAPSGSPIPEQDLRQLLGLLSGLLAPAGGDQQAG